MRIIEEQRLSQLTNLNCSLCNNSNWESSIELGLAKKAEIFF